MDGFKAGIEQIARAYETTGILHHAYLFEGDHASISPLLFDFFEKRLQFPTKGNPDLWVETFEQFGVSDGRVLKDLQSRNALAHDMRIFVLSLRFITDEAQNSLLKVFEEPAEHTHFFLVVPSADALLPTVRSRLYVVSEMFGTASPNEVAHAQKFLHSVPVDRLRLIEPIIADKDKDKALSFFGALEVALEQQVNDAKGSVPSDLRKALEHVQKYRGYLQGRAPSVKTMLENIAFTLPRAR